VSTKAGSARTVSALVGNSNPPIAAGMRAPRQGLEFA
jgi:hypothetical protein